MPLSRRQLLKYGSMLSLSATFTIPHLGYSSNKVMEFIQSHFNYDSNNQFFTDKAITEAQRRLNEFKQEGAINLLKSINNYTELNKIRADDLPTLDNMVEPYEPTAASRGLKAIHQRFGKLFPSDMMQEWLTLHKFNPGIYDLQEGIETNPSARHRRWLAQPQVFATELEQANVNYLYPDVLYLATNELPDKPIQPRPVSLDLEFIRQLDAAAQAGQNGLSSQDRPLLDRRYLYEYLQETSQRDLFFKRNELENTYKSILEERALSLPFRQEVIDSAREEGVNIDRNDYDPDPSELSTTALLYVTVSRQLITRETLTHLKHLLTGDLRDRYSEWGGRVMIKDGRLHFQKDPIVTPGENDRINRRLPKYVASDFSAWHAHAIESLNESASVGPSSLDLSGGAARRGMPEFVVTPVGQRGNNLRMNIDIYQTTRSCIPSESIRGACPWISDPNVLSTFVVDLGIFEA
ncbi:MAG: hypothetical protein ABEL51_00555 [Salinibacter sp.]